MTKRVGIVAILSILLVTAVVLSGCGLGSDAGSPTPAPVAVSASLAPTAAALPAVQPPAPTTRPIPPAAPTRPPAPSPALAPTQVAGPSTPGPAPAPTAPPVPSATQPAPTPAPEATPTVEPERAAVAEPKTTPGPAPGEAAAEPTVSEGSGNGSEAGAALVSLTSSGQALPTVEVVKLLRPSVVQIVTELAGMAFSNSAVPPTGVGTGVVLDLEGHILTNNHVVANAQRITATLNTGESFPAAIVGTDVATDLAIIRIQADNLTPAKLGVSADLEVGEDVIAIGHALGLAGGPTVSKGVVSALGRTINTDAQNTIIDLIQTDASINPGNSGGPLVNDRAEVIGINTAIIQGSRGIGFAINIDDAKVVASQLMEQGFVRRGFLGIRPINLTPAIASQIGIDATEGVVVVFVIDGSAAQAAGLQIEDIILKLGDETIRNTGELSKFLIDHPPGETVDILILRQGRELPGQITLGERPG